MASNTGEPCMRVISRRTLNDYTAANKRKDADAFAEQLDAWYQEVRSAGWADPNDLKAKYRSASVLKDGRAVFNICGNKYRVVVKINYKRSIVYIRLIGTHEEYDAISAQEV
jgi:mRNA interferase HigB